MTLGPTAMMHVSGSSWSAVERMHGEMSDVHEAYRLPRLEQRYDVSGARRQARPGPGVRRETKRRDIVISMHSRLCLVRCHFRFLRLLCVLIIGPQPLEFTGRCASQLRTPLGAQWQVSRLPRAKGNPACATASFVFFVWNFNKKAPGSR